MIDFLWMQGKIMVAQRQGLNKFWDMAERVLPEWHGLPSPVYIVTTSRLLPAKTRSFIAFASRQLAEQLAPRGVTLDEAELAALYDLQEA